MPQFGASLCLRTRQHVTASLLEQSREGVVTEGRSLFKMLRQLQCLSEDVPTPMGERSPVGIDHPSPRATVATSTALLRST